MKKGLTVLQFWVVPAIFALLLLAGVLNYTTSRSNLTHAALSGREATAYLAAVTLKENFKRMDDVVRLALASRTELYQLLQNLQLKEAARLLNNLPQEMPFVDRILLANPNGAFVGQEEKIAELSEKDSGFQQWYETEAVQGKPYISDIYQAAEAPHPHVIAIAAPLWSSGKKLQGLLVLQIRLEKLLQWVQELEAGPSGYVYFVDRKGRVAAHPNYPEQGAIPDFSSSPEVQKVLQGKQGVGVFFNPVEKNRQVVAYQPVPGFGWGAIAAQPAAQAFAMRGRFLRRLLIVYSVILAMGACLAGIILYAIRIRKRAEEVLKQMNEQLEIKVKERTQDLQQEVVRRTAAENSLKRAVEKLKESNAELEQFAFIASHDLQEPLHKIIIFGDLLETLPQKLDEKGQDFLRRISNAANRMRELITSLLQLSRVTTQAHPFERIELESAVREAVSDLEARISELKARVEIKGQWPTLSADKVQMRQLFENLLANALKFHKKDEPPRVTVKSKISGGQVEVEVEDHGIGFEEEYRERIFEPFKRLHTREEFEGSGIGLATCLKIAARHGGKITARSTLGKGSVFTITLPIADPA